LKIRIFALAKELKLDSKELIEICNEAGVKLKNSALASISPEERDIVVSYFESRGESGSRSSSRGVAVPVREAPRTEGGKVRAITSPAPLRSRGRVSPTTANESSSVSAVDASSVADESTEDSSEVAAVANSADGQSEAASEEVVDTTAPDEAAADQPGELDAGTPVAGISRDEYVPPAGAAGRTIREMRPRGTVPGGNDRSSQRKEGRSKPAMPNIAAPPAYKPLKPKAAKPAESKAQKPDLPLTPEILQQQSPLSSHIRKHAEQKQRKKKGKTGGTPDDLRRAANAEQAREQERRDRGRTKRRRPQDGGMGGGRSRFSRRRRQKRTGPIVLKTSGQIEMPITIRSLSEAIGRPAKDLIRVLFQQGQMITINENIDEEMALELATEMGVDLEVRQQRDIEQELVATLEETESDELLEPRPPIITILGHVDHGKTTMLDTLRHATVAAGEAGGITQHIASYQIEHDGKKLTFVDTPGHAAFSEMRARGANVTDIVVLVVAANDGVMPQTVECISHARAADVPIVVALNKVDLPDVDEQRVLQDLAKHELLPVEWGGDVEVIRTSGETGQGLDDLVETLLLTAELQEYKANRNRPAVGVCIEGFRDEGRGSLAWFVVQKGSLKIGDVVLCGEAYGRIRAIYNDRDEEIDEAGPSMPVKVAGLNLVPGAGQHFYVLPDIEEARETAESRHDRGRAESLSGGGRPRSLDDILEAAREGAVQDLPLIVKADTPGSLEALHGEITKFEHPEVRVAFVHEGVGGVNESDVALAGASGAVIIAFHVIAEDRAAALAEHEGVDIRRYNVIYEVTETIRQSLEGLLRPEKVEVATGRALVLRTFHVSRFGTIAGCRILSGTIGRSNRVHVIRASTLLNDYSIASLRREKDDVREVREGMECGIRLEGFNDIKEGDLLEAFRIDEVKRTLD